jgi:ankyrin repeat protein
MRRSRFFTICIGLALACTAAAPQRAESAPINGDNKSALFPAIRDGDLAAVKALLATKQNLNAQDNTGTTALMQAALNADVEMMKLLVIRGADLNAQNASGATALLWSLHEPDKVKLLLDHGAKVSEAAVFAAVVIPGASRTVTMLGEKGADFNLSRGGFTPLMAATRGGDIETIRYLLDRGADARAKSLSGYTALFGAASWPGNAQIVRLLLQKGADPNTRVAVTAPVSDLFTPAMSAAMRGDGESLQHLLVAGADVNIQGGDFGRTALLWSATTGREEVIRLLLGKGADLGAKDHLGNSAWDWAKRRGDTSITKLIEKADRTKHPQADASDELARLQIDLGPEAVGRAVAKSLPLLQRSGETFTTRKGCVSCHHQSLVAMTVGLVRKHGFDVDEEIANRERTGVLHNFERSRERILVGAGVTDELVPAYSLAGLAAEEQQPNVTTDALVHFLVLRQRPDGSWLTPVYRPPHDASEFTFTALAVRGLRLFAPKGRKNEIARRIALARDWLLRAQPSETEDSSFQLLGLAWANADRPLIEVALAALLREQRSDGGWAQLHTLRSDAYATGQALFALHVGGGLAVNDPAYRRGVEFLLKNQLADGSWLVPTRSFPLQPYVETNFPHGRSQFISIAATCWATMALALTRAP